MHEQLCDVEAMVVAVDEAIAMAAEEFKLSPGGDWDFYGDTLQGDFKNFFEDLANAGKSASVVAITGGRGMLFNFTSRGEIIAIDSHLHGETGAVYALSSAGKAAEMVEWFNNMLLRTWGVAMQTCKCTQVHYDP